MDYHFKLYKPNNYLSQFIYEKKRHKNLLGSLYNFPGGTMAIGRLDEDTEGLLFLTTDGIVSEIIRSKKVEKEYFVQVDGIITASAIAELKLGVEIGVKGTKYITKPCEADFLPILPDCVGAGHRIRDGRHGPTSWLRIIITEGKFRQVRKMTAKVGFPTLRLIRYRIGNETLDGLKIGDVIAVTSFDI
ncbi:pseudouridine synthase [Flavobacterium agricola]|uniref:Pseudouridine synthase n=1 Tax=Flavobacterium agricola TaxID=2870839 RepID=A0ABY6LYZ6_9FLAO|nr:pseudouridine synthase [Flavobacterium agricola]UYW01548.1 pseudouridine synthase [Flavobacterium agricola]